VELISVNSWKKRCEFASVAEAETCEIRKGELICTRDLFSSPR